jgi:hypothetical protein
VDQMASHYVSQMRTVQAHGPYLLCGYCFGGILAFEMAQQLIAQGEHVALVAMLNAQLRFNRPSTAPVLDDPLAVFVDEPPRPRGPRPTGLRRIVLGIRWRVNLLFERAPALYRFLPMLRITLPHSMRREYVHQMTIQAEKDYFPKPYPGHLTLFRGVGAYDYDPNLGWAELCTGGISIHEIGSIRQRSRTEMIHEPVVRELAQQLKICIDQVHRALSAETASTDAHAESQVPAAFGTWPSAEAMAETSSA